MCVLFMAKQMCTGCTGFACTQCEISPPEIKQNQNKKIIKNNNNFFANVIFTFFVKMLTPSEKFAELLA